MRKQNRSCSMLTTAKSRYHFGTNKIIKSKKLHQSVNDDNKRGYSAEGYSLLTSALRPRLFGARKNSKSISNSFSSTRNKSFNNSSLRFTRENLAFTIPIISVTILSIFSLFQNNTNASATSATLTIPDAISINVNPTLNDRFAESTPGKVSVSTSNLGGYTLSIKSKNNSNDLVNESDSNAKLASITTELSTEQYKTGDYANTWGFKPDYVDSSPNTSYRPGPTSSGITLVKTNSDSALDNINLAIAAKVDSNTITGNYTNTFVLTAVPNEAKYNITYNLNGGSGGPGNITETGDIGSSTEIAVNGTAPTAPSGKDFLGWCSKNPGEGDTCDGVLVQPGKSLYLCKCDLNITLYAMYGKSTPKPGENGSDCIVTGHNGKLYAGYCWTWADVGNDTWNNAKQLCDDMGWSLPTQAQFQALLNAIGKGGQLFNAEWRYSHYWSSTFGGMNSAYYLIVSGSSASISSYINTSNVYGVRCVSQ